MINDALRFLINIVFGLFVYSALLRFIMQWLRAPFRNPVGQAVSALTDWAVKPLRKRGVNVAVFNPPLVPARLHALNLRNHRKILVVDGALGFTGGLNVDCRYWKPEAPDQAFRDLHFRLRGPVLAQLMEIFADDWQFTTDEALRGPKWFPPVAEAGGCLARAIEAGPDEAFERVRWAILGGLNAAQRSIKVLTPYFIPDQTLIAALDAAALQLARRRWLLRVPDRL